MSIRAEARIRIRELMITLAARGFSGAALAREIGAQCPWEETRWKRGWQEVRRDEVGCVRRRKDHRREFAGMLRMGVDQAGLVSEPGDGRRELAG